MPIFAQIGLLQQLTGLIYFPITPTLPALRAVARRRLPAGQVPDPLPGADPDRPVGRRAVGRQGARADGGRGGPRADPGGARTTCSPSAARCGSDEPALLITGVSTYWGGRLAQALEARPRRRDDHRRLARRPDAARSSAPSTSASAPSTRCCGGSCTPREIDTVVDTRLIVDSAAPRRRAVAHEMNVIGTMNILAACGGPDSPVRKVVFKSSAHYYGCERDDPAFFTEDDAAPAPAAHAAGERHRRGREGRRAASPSATRTSR